MHARAGHAVPRASGDKRHNIASAAIEPGRNHDRAFRMECVAIAVSVRTGCINEPAARARPRGAMDKE
jgi:hypothetical protein